MGGTPNVAGMVNDQDFQGLSLSDKRAALGKVTGDASFDKLSDADTTQFLTRFAKPAQSPEQAAIAGLPNAAAQSKQQVMSNAPGLTRGTGRYSTGIDAARDRNTAQTTSMVAGLTGTPDVSNVTPNQAATGINAGLLAAGGMTAPAATALGAVGAAAGGPALKSVATNLGASPGAAEMWGTTGNIIGGLAGGEAGARLAGKLPLMDWVTASKTAGAHALQEASNKAGSAPVELSGKTNEIVDKIVQQSKLGGPPFKPVSDLLDRVGPSTRQAADANPGPLTYDEARILQSNISRLSAAEQMTLKGQMKSLVPQLAKSLGQDVQDAADKAGVGQEHSFGMQQYATAAARNRALVKGAKIAGVGAATGGIGLVAEQALKKAVSK
jgi:hypothetical protein